MTHRDDRKSASHLVPGIVTAALLVTAVVAPACKGVVVTTIEPPTPPSVGQIGDPCTPSGEQHAAGAGLAVSATVLEDGAAGCNSGICLVNHFQGRVTCPLGQEAPARCAGPDDQSCGDGASCVATEHYYGPHCDPTADGGAPQCGSGVCNPQRSTCECTMDSECPGDTVCDQIAHECTLYVCRKPGGCQSADASDAENAGKICCVDGTTAPVSEGVCGQCGARPAEETVYCSCRCGPADGAPPDGSDYCACPAGLECAEIIPYVGLGSASVSGRYCIKTGTAYQSTSTTPAPDQCGTVSGHFASYCDGTPAN